MSRTLEPTLSGLIPTHVGPIPGELLDLANSLVAQSRARISNLKPNEETARIYVCCHIACLRLKNKLHLASITVVPPMPQRGYEKLLTHFQTQLVPTTTRSAPAEPAASARPKRTVRTTTTTTATTPPVAPKPAATTRKLAPQTDDLTKVITTLCTRLDIPNALSHILTGYKTMLADPENAGVRGKTFYAIAMAVTILVIERLAPHGDNNPMQVGNISWQRGSGYKYKQKEVMDVFSEVVDLRVVARGLGRGHVDDWVQKMSQGGFRKWKWMAEIPDGVGGGGSGKGRVEVPDMVAPRESSPNAKESIAKPTETQSKKRKAPLPTPAPEPKSNPEHQSKKAKPKATEPEPEPKTRPRVMAKKKANHGGGGGGKMLQERVDFLSEKKMNAFRLWKEAVLERCDAIELAAQA
ncbi:origin recognition complex subunit 6-domain-containing protein [Sphaerosporella brunnea]|uniref:Origin recognition complex subunit 6-domain-containing protein n=1 Tax=Sphaerosporella brunnea TaxID=1250544 RepID=A0A5J5EG56_9PEZI|nr:origin recognition complex subunit 6-domain-containing protein [Sphaerosporella brunnea]